MLEYLLELQEEVPIEKEDRNRNVEELVLSRKKVQFSNIVKLKNYDYGNFPNLEK